MLYYNRTGVPERINLNKRSASKKCHYWYFSDKEFKFQLAVCNGCHDVLMMFTGLNSIVILNIHCVDYPCIFVGISKNEAINVLRNADFS